MNIVPGLGLNMVLPANHTRAQRISREVFLIAAVTKSEREYATSRPIAACRAAKKALLLNWQGHGRDNVFDNYTWAVMGR